MLGLDRGRRRRTASSTSAATRSARSRWPARCARPAFDVERPGRLRAPRPSPSSAELLDRRGRAAAPEPRRSQPFALIGAADRAALPGRRGRRLPGAPRPSSACSSRCWPTSERTTYHNVTSFRIRGRPAGSPLRRAAGRRGAAGAPARGAAHLVRPDQLLGAAAAGARRPPSCRSAHDHGRADRRGPTGPGAARLHRRRAGRPVRPRPRRRCCGSHAHDCADGSWWLTLTECHPILDGWSHHSLMMELLGAYQQFRDGRAARAAAAPAGAVRRLRRRRAGGGRRRRRTGPTGGRVADRPGPFGLPAGWGDPSRPRRRHQHDALGAGATTSTPRLRALAGRRRAR